MYGVNLSVLAERHAALHYKATRLQARAVDAASRIANWRLERDEEVRITRRVVNDRRYSKHLTSLSLRSLELELIQTQMAQKPMLRAEVGMRVRCANKASAE